MFCKTHFNLSHVPEYAGLGVLALALFRLIEWSAQNYLGADWFASRTSMKLVTACSFLLIGGALLFEKRLGQFRLAAIGLFVCALSALSFLIDFDRLILPQAGWLSGVPFGDGNTGLHMSPATALALGCAGLSLILHMRRKWVYCIPALSVMIGLIAFTTLLGFAYNVEQLHSIPGFRTVTFPTSVGLLLVAVGILTRRGVVWPELPLRAIIAALVLGALFPALVHMYFQTRRASSDYLIAVEQKGRGLTEQVASQVDRMMAERISLLRGLATSPALRSEDLSIFYDQAKAVINPDEGGILLIDESMQFLLSTTVPFGSALPIKADAPASARVRATGRPVISDLFASPFTGKPIVSVHVPVSGSNNVLILSLQSSWFGRQLQLPAPLGWTVAVIDNNGVVVARSRDSENTVGRPASLTTIQKMRQADAGWDSTVGLEGYPINFAWKRLSFGWTLIAGYEERRLSNEFRSRSEELSLNVILMILLGLTISTFAAFSISQPIANLSAAARALGQGNFETSGRTGSIIREIRAVGDALRDAALARREMEHSLRLSEKEAKRQYAIFRSMFDCSPEAMVLSDAERSIQEVNGAFTAAFGYTKEELYDISTRILYARQTDWTAASEFLAQGRTGVLFSAVDFRRKNGEIFPGQLAGSKLIDASGHWFGYVGIIRDVSKERDQELALREQKRLESLGRLTGGVAHDFNNVLTIISANIQLVETKCNDPAQIQWLSEATKAIDIGARLNRRLMTFARQRKLEPAVLDLNDLVSSIFDLIGRSCGEHIAFTSRLEADKPSVRLDASEMENAIVNLAINARDAMPDGGQLVLATKTIGIKGHSARWPHAAPGRYVELSVSDTGQGMTDEVKAQAFDPFFTTKEEGKGTGLGLTTVHGFVHQSGGQIAIESEVGQGTTISILLPLVEAISASGAPTPRKSRLVLGTGQTILLVEDNIALRRVAKELIIQLGYTVLEADSGPAAIAVLRSGKRIDLVFSDVVMPGGMSGLDLADYLAKETEQLPILLTSGFIGMTPPRKEEHTSIQVLAKPYSVAELSQALATRLAIRNVSNHRTLAGPYAGLANA